MTGKFSEASRKSSVRSNNTNRLRNTLHSQSKALVFDKKSEDMQERLISLQVPPKGYILETLKVLLFIMVIITYLICAVIHFIHTDDMIALGIALAYTSAYVGIAQISPLIPWSKQEKGDQQN